MQKTYTKNYIKIYLWQGVSILIGFVSLFIVMPKLTKVPVIYGVYSICVSVTFFLTYADIGFVSAGYKYISEKFAIANLNEEIKIVGFVSFVLLVFALLFSAVMLIFAVNPHILIRGLSSPGETAIASKLLLILALFSPTVIFQRLCQMVFGIRLEDFIYQRIFIVVNLLRVGSIFYFFSGAKYNIVGYFLFFQIVGLISYIFSLAIIRSRYNYDLGLLARSLRFSSGIYSQTRKLALGVFSTTLISILYYELDLFVIGKLSGAEKAAFYAVGLTIMTFFRGILGVIYGPFLARFNHFMGINDMNSLKNVLYSVIVLTLPLVVFPIVTVIMLMRPTVLCWVGANYVPSIIVAQFLVASFIYNFFVQAGGILLTTQARVRTMIVISLAAVFVYWAGICTTFSFMSILAFAIFKFIAFTVSAVFYFILVARFLGFKPVDFMRKIIKPAVIPVIFLMVVLTYISRFMPVEKNKIDLLVVVGTGGLASFIALCLYYLSSDYSREYFNNVFVIGAFSKRRRSL